MNDRFRSFDLWRTCDRLQGVRLVGDLGNFRRRDDGGSLLLRWGIR